MPNKNTSEFMNNLKLQKNKLIISILWLLGLIAGKTFAYISSWDFITCEVFLDTATTQPINILLTATTVLIGCFACAINNGFLYIFLFLKAITYAIVSVNIMTVFDEAGWLLRILLLSVETLQIAVLIFFSIQSAGKDFSTIKRNAIVATIISLILVSLDIYLMTPFTTSLLDG